ALDRLGHGERLARAGDAQEHLVALRLARGAFAAQTSNEFLDRRRLIAGRLIVRHQLEPLAALAFLGPFWAMRHKCGELSPGHMAKARRRFGKAAYRAEPRTIVVRHMTNIGGVRPLCTCERLRRAHDFEYTKPSPETRGWFNAASRRTLVLKFTSACPECRSQPAWRRQHH